MSPDESSSSTGWTKLYHPRGPLVTLPVTAAPLDYARLLANVSLMLDAGWLVAAPGLEAGEFKEMIGYVVMRTKENKDETSTPVIDLYPANDVLKFAHVSVYLNTPADEEAFEYASGLKLDALKPYVGDNKIERGKSRQTDQFVHAAPKPFEVVWRDNPKHDPNEQDTSKKKPKRLFVRWTNQKPTAPANQPPAATVPPPPVSPPPAPTGNAAKPPANGLPANGVELHARLKAFDSQLAAQRRCQPGELVAHVTQVGVRAGYPASLAAWSGPAIQFAVNVAKDFDASHKIAG